MAEMNGSIGQDAQANGEIYLGQNVSVGGNVVYGTQLTVDVGVSIAGSTSQGTTVVAPATFTGVSLPVPAAFSGGAGTVDDAGSSLASPLAPGTYGTLEAKEIYLTAGTYIFSAIEVVKNADLYLDLSAGAIEIFVEGDVLFDGPSKTLDVFVSADGTTSVEMSSADPLLASQVWLETHGTFRANRISEWFGSVYAPNEGIVAPELSVIGAIYAGGHVDGDASAPGIELLIGSGVQTHYFVAPGYQAIPEPTTALLLALGLVGLALRRRE